MISVAGGPPRVRNTFATTLLALTALAGCDGSSSGRDEDADDDDAATDSDSDFNDKAATDIYTTPHSNSYHADGYYSHSRA